MQSIELIRDNLQKSRDRVLSRIEEMHDHCLVFPTPQGGCHTLWVLGHLAYIEALVIQEIMLAEPHPLQAWKVIFDGDVIHSEPDYYPSFEEVLLACRAMRQTTLKLLDTLNETELDTKSQRVPAGVEDMFGSYRLCFQFVSDHWYMHRGQLADARRAAGLTRMWF